MSNELQSTLKTGVQSCFNDLLRVRLCLSEWLSLNFVPAHAAGQSSAPVQSISPSLLGRRSRRAFMLPRFTLAPMRRQRSMPAPNRRSGKWCELQPRAHRLR